MKVYLYNLAQLSKWGFLVKKLFQFALHNSGVEQDEWLWSAHMNIVNVQVEVLYACALTVLDASACRDIACMCT